MTEIVEVTHSGVAPTPSTRGAAALADRPFVERSAPIARRGGALAGEALAGLNGVRYAAPDGAFYAFIGVDGLTDSLAWRAARAEHGVAVAPGQRVRRGGRGLLRVCFAQSRPSGWSGRCSGCGTASRPWFEQARAVGMAFRVVFQHKWCMCEIASATLATREGETDAR